MSRFPAGAPRIARRIVTPLAAALFLLTGVASADDDEPGLGPPPLYDELREAEPEAAGHIRGGRLWIDRFEFELERGDLFLTPPVGNHAHVAVFLGRGTIRAWPPDGVEHQQLRKLIDEDSLEEEFERFVFWFSGDLDERLRAQVTEPPAAGGGRSARRQRERAVDLLEDRREALLEDRLRNPDARVALDRWRAASGLAEPTGRPYLFAELDGREHDWFSIEIEPRDLEEVTIGKFDRRRKLLDVWMSFHALDEFDRAQVEPTLGRFPRDPETAGPVHPEAERDDDEWSFRDYGLSPRYLVPDEERWRPRMGVSRTDVDMAIEGNGDVRASVALVMEPLAPLAAFRLSISPFADVTDVRWRTDLPPDVDDATRVALLAPDRAPPELVAERDPDEADDGPPGPDEPAPIAGEQLHYVQATHDRRFSEDLHDPWLTVLLPRPVGAGERFVLEIAYEAELIERLRDASGYLLKDTGLWIPRHPDNRRRRFDLTFRTPEDLRIASGGALLDERVEDDTRIMRWVTNRPVRGTMSFHMGRFEVDEVTRDGLPPIAVYADRNHVGFAPGNREKTLEDLVGSLRTYIDYFGPYPFDSLLVTETRSSGGQAFPGLVLLTFQVFGALHTGESELFRAHEVAHQWWGAGADWESYRDQWITEGFANYSAALYVLAGLGEEDQFRDMLDAWRLDALGEVNVGQGFGKRYGFVPAVIRESDGNESGPLVAGFRLRTTDTPFDYRLIVYEKGAFVLHMLRMLLMDLETGDDRRFRDLMRGFMDAHVGRVASTRAFEAAVTEAFGEPMDWFFDQWVYGVDVPTYRPDLEVSPLRDAREPFVLHGRVRQEDVPPGFRMAVPIRLEFRDREPIVHRVWIDRPEVEVEIPLPAEPARIDFNYLHGVLARVR
ncbi:MAG: hypothetical protein J4G16_07850 [Acidobacteria bacterium]|nr:hypothetical protein [Acidobacteriota bacterium]